MHGCISKSRFWFRSARTLTEAGEFFIKYLTDENDIVVDIFSGSNTTGQACEKYNRNWISIDLDLEYVAAPAFRFIPKNIDKKLADEIYKNILSNNETIDLSKFQTGLVTLFD